MNDDPDKTKLLSEASRAAARAKDPNLSGVPVIGRLFMLAGRLGWSIALPLVLAAWGGHALDVYFGTGIQIAAAAIVVAAIAGFSIMWKDMSR